MQPKERGNAPTEYKPKWRHFHPQSVLFLRNPFDEDIIFQVADENNEPWQYRLVAKKINELPGGAIATLGLKHVIDRMIGENGTDAVRIWDTSVRQKYEDQVIVKVKENPASEKQSPEGIVDLGTTDDEDTIDKPKESKPKDVPFKSVVKGRSASQNDRMKADLAAVAAASLNSTDQVIEQD